LALITTFEELKEQGIYGKKSKFQNQMSKKQILRELRMDNTDKTRILQYAKEKGIKD
jgi:hypothetical protein